MSGENTPRGPNRRSLLKAIGVGFAATAFTGRATADQEYEETVDIVAAGADDTGTEPIDDVFADLAGDDTLIEFPEGRYKINSITLYGLSNFGMVGTGDVVLVPGDSYDPRLWIAGTNNRNVHIENFTIDNTADGVGPTVDVNAYDGLVVRNIRKVGYHGVNRPAFGFRIIEEDGTGLVENLQCPDGGASVAIYTDPAGTITYRDCRVENFADNGIYGSIGSGRVHVEGGFYRNNNVASIRLGGPGSSVTDATVVVDDPPDEFGDCRGIRLSDGPGPVYVEDCEIRMLRGHGTGGVVCESDGGSLTVRGTRIRIEDGYTVGSTGERTSYAVYVDSTDDEVGSRTIENTAITGGGTELAAIRIARDNNTIRNVCIEQSGTYRSGVLFLGSHDNVVEQSSITVPSEQIRLDGDATVERNDITTGVDCGGSASDQEGLGSNVLTVVGDGETAHYEFTVDGSVEKSTAYDGTINDYDTIHDDGRVTGRTTNEPDSFAVDGDVLGFHADAPVEVSVDGETVDPETLGSNVLTVVGDGETAHYEFTVDGDVEKSTAYGGTINEYDTIHDDGSVTGRTTSEPDSFVIDGDLVAFDADADVVVHLNGREVDPALLGSFVVTVAGRGTTAYYEFRVDGSVEKSTAYDGTINEYDTIHDDGRVTGRTTNEPDSFDCTGILHSFESDAPVDVYADGELIETN